MLSKLISILVHVVFHRKLWNGDIRLSIGRLKKNVVLGSPMENY